MTNVIPSVRATKAVARRKRSEAKAELRGELLDLVISGYSHEAIAEKLGLHVASVRRQVALALEARPVEAPHLYVALQTARLQKAVRVVDLAMEEGDCKAIAPLIKTLAALDRYHGVALCLGRARSGDVAEEAPAGPTRRLANAAKRAQSDTQSLEITCALTAEREREAPLAAPLYSAAAASGAERIVEDRREPALDLVDRTCPCARRSPRPDRARPWRRRNNAPRGARNRGRTRTSPATSQSSR